MIHCAQPKSTNGPREFVLAASLLLTTAASAYAQTATTPASHPSAAIPEVPNLPNVVTVVPFYEKPDESEEEASKVIIPAEIDGRHGLFIVDLGCPQLYLNHTFFQPSPSGGVDSVTDANRIPERKGDATEDTAHVKVVRIGTISIEVVEPTIPAPNTRHLNAFLNHAFGNYHNFAPRLGNIGLSVLEPFETIIDYTHRRLILIRLDSAGRRLAKVPAYTPAWTAPLVDWAFPPYVPKRFAGLHEWGVQADVDGVTHTFIFDTGAPINVVNPKLATHTTNYALPHLVIAGRTFDTVPVTMMDRRDSLNVLGYPFLQQFGTVGLNHRTHQLIVYH